MTVLFALLACTGSKTAPLNEPSPVEDTGSTDTIDTGDTNDNDTSLETGDTNPDTDTADSGDFDTSPPYNLAYFKSMHNAYSGEERGTIHEQLDAGFRGLEFDIHDNDFENIGLNKYLILQDPLEKIFYQNKENNNIDEDLINKLKTFDLIMIGYKTQSKIIDKILVKKILNKRKQKPILFVDCGIPGNIKTDIGQIPNCFLFDLNDLEQLYSSWIQNSFTNEDGNNELFDIELKISLDSFFRKLKFNLEQKMIFENKVNSLVKAKGKEIKFFLKKFLKSF